MLAACSIGCASHGATSDPLSIDAAPESDAVGPTMPDAAPLTCRGKSAQPTDATWMVDGRRVGVHVPASYDPTLAVAVVIDLHGLASTGADQARVAHMIEASDAHGFVAVHPNGTGLPRGWNGGDCCNPASASGVDDTAFISSVIDELDTELCLDPDRVFAIGLSNGGFLAHRLGCELADRIAAIGAVAGVLGIDSCNPVRPMPVFHVHGTSDPIIPYGGGGANNNISVDDTIAGWVARDHCTGEPETTYDNGDATCVTHGGCDGGADVVLCTIAHGGHQWPGGENIGPLAGTLSNDLDATEAAWAFFAAHPRAR